MGKSFLRSPKAKAVRRRNVRYRSESGSQYLFSWISGREKACRVPPSLTGQFWGFTPSSPLSVLPRGYPPESALDGAILGVSCFPLFKGRPPGHFPDNPRTLCGHFPVFCALGLRQVRQTGISSRRKVFFERKSLPPLPPLNFLMVGCLRSYIGSVRRIPYTGGYWSGSAESRRASSSL